MSSLNGERVLVTGSTGFVGSNLVRSALSQGADVYATSRETSDTWRINEIISDISVIQVDITAYEKIKSAVKKIRPTIIFHTAVYGGNAAQNDVATMVESNVLGTVNLLRCCEGIKYDLFVNTGSSSEYGIKDLPMKETDLLEPITDYGVSKAAATLFCRSEAINKKLPIVTFRLFSPYGPYEGKSRLIPSVILSSIRRINPKIASRQYVRDFIFIDDVLDAYNAVIDLQNPSGKIFNIGSGQQHTVGEVIDTIIRLLGEHVTFETDLPQIWKHEPSFWEADIHRAKSELHWEPKYTLEEGLNATIDWFTENMGLYA